MSLWSRIANVFRGDGPSHEIDEELQSHIAEALENGTARNERCYGGLDFRLHEQVELVQARPLEHGLEKTQDENAHTSIAAIRRQGCEVDEDPQPSPL